jgi:serine/threonine-protein kinase
VKIHSEHVARVLDVGTSEAGTPYMVMEYLDGEDLEHVLASRGPLPVEEAVGIVLEACEAIAEAHSLGIVHRDLKPANLFLARRPSGKAIVKVLDFGISKIAQGTKTSSTTSTTALMGSPAYMSPEQIRTPTTVDVRTDVWCLGVVLYEVLSQRLPFEAGSMPELVFTIVEKPHVPLSALRADVPDALAAIVDRCLEKTQAHRFGDVGALARALAPYGGPRAGQSLEHIEHVLGTASGSPLDVAPAVGVVRPRPEGQTFSPITSQALPMRSRLWLVPLLGIGVAGVAAALFFTLRPARTVVPASSPSTVAVSTSAPATSPSTPTTTSVTPPAAEGPTAVQTAATTSSPAPSSTLPWWAGKPAPATHAPTHPTASATTVATAAPAASCHVVSYFDADGNKHFKQQCP